MNVKLVLCDQLDSFARFTERDNDNQNHKSNNINEFGFCT